MAAQVWIIQGVCTCVVRQPVPPIPPDDTSLASRRAARCMLFPVTGVIGSGRIMCAYQNQIPPALLVLPWIDSFSRSRSFAARVLSTPESILSMRLATG